MAKTQLLVKVNDEVVFSTSVVDTSPFVKGHFIEFQTFKKVEGKSEIVKHRAEIIDVCVDLNSDMHTLQCWVNPDDVEL